MAMHLLIADDEPSVLLMLRTFFERSGYQISTARNGQEAINLAWQLRPDMILLDIQMPIKSGVDVVRELRSHPEFAGIPMLAITAHVRDYLPTAVKNAGFDQLVTKPFEFAELQDVVTLLLKRYYDQG